MMIDTIHLDNETIITQIGTLECNISDGYVMRRHIEDIRPTVAGDMIGDPLTVKALDVNLHHYTGSIKEILANAIMYVTACAIRQLNDDEVDGKILLCIAKRQQRWNVMIVCNAYVPQPNQV